MISEKFLESALGPSIYFASWYFDTPTCFQRVTSAYFERYGPCMVRGEVCRKSLKNGSRIDLWRAGISGARSAIRLSAEPGFGMKVYLCGGIHALSDAEAQGWRERAKALLAPHATVLDPMLRVRRDVDDDELHTFISGDLREIAESDAL